MWEVGLVWVLGKVWNTYPWNLLFWTCRRVFWGQPVWIYQRQSVAELGDAMAGSVEDGRAVNRVSLAFNMAFGVISPDILMTKLVRDGLDKQVTRSEPD